MTEIRLPRAAIYPDSIVEYGGATFFLCRLDADRSRRLGIRGLAAGFAGGEPAGDARLHPCTPEHAAALRERLPWLRPIALDTRPSFGFGDRLGSATPGHIQAIRATGADRSIAPIYAQQSVRENARTGRTPQPVLDDAMWGVLAEGWRETWGTDADHVKEIADLAPFVAAGYTFYTIDPSDYVDNAAQTDGVPALRAKADGLPWDRLRTSYGALRERYCAAPFALGGLAVAFAEADLLRALLSIHTGSDKFSIYPAIARQTHGRVHVKTAGTSCLEALRLATSLAPDLFHAMLDHAREHFAYDRKSYFLDAQLDKVPAGRDVADADLPALLEQFDTLQVLHVTFGSCSACMAPRLPSWSPRMKERFVPAWSNTSYGTLPFVE